MVCKCNCCKRTFVKASDYSSVIWCSDCLKKNAEEIEEKSKNYKLKCCNCFRFFKRPSKHSSSIICPECMEQSRTGEITLKMMPFSSKRQEYDRFEMMDLD